MPEQFLRTHYTVQDYEEFPDDGTRYEIITGDLHMTPAPSIEHQKLSGRLHLILAAWVSRGAGGELLYAPVDVHLAFDTVVQPDLLWISPEQVPVILKDRVRGAPDLVIEILSPRTSRVDQTVKRDRYAFHGVREYWLVDPEQKSLTVLALRERKFASHDSGTGSTPVRSAIDPSLEVVPAKLFAGLA